MVEAIYCGCHPVLPNRLTYPGLIPESLHNNYLYNDFDEFVERMHTLISERTYSESQELREIAKKFDWAEIVIEYDQKLENIAARHS